jgi:ubiquinone/menaquinone biosynthesis C-methylase UbiE
MLPTNRTVAKDTIAELDLDARVSIEARITDARVEHLDFSRFATMDTRLESYAAHCAWRAYLFSFLGSVQDKIILDIACGYSMTPVLFALAGATVYAVDVAPKTIATLQRFAEYKGVADRVHVYVGPAETLPFADAQFDLIYGGAALHHVQLDQVGPELARVLKPGGKGAFQDPLGHNWLFEFARDYLPYRGKHPAKGTDRPLHVQEIAAFGRHFTTCTYRGFEFISVGAKALHLKRHSRLRRAIEGLDARILARFPSVQRYARYVVTCVTT